jgi:hypothetical protein
MTFPKDRGRGAGSIMLSKAGLRSSTRIIRTFGRSLATAEPPLSTSQHHDASTATIPTLRSEHRFLAHARR